MSSERSTFSKLLEKHGYRPIRGWVHRPSNDIDRHVYVHIPKTGGNTLKSVLNPKTTDHSTSPMYNPDDGPYFATVRNPYSWLISMWHYNWPGHPKYPGVQDIFKNLEDFLFRFNSDELLNSAFWDGPTEFTYISWQLRHLQIAQTFEPFRQTGKFHSIADFYVRLEKLDVWLGVDNLKKRNASAHEDYRSYYTADLIDHIEQWRRQELDMLGYDIEGPTDSLITFEITKGFSFYVSRTPALSRTCVIVGRGMSVVQLSRLPDLLTTCEQIVMINCWSSYPEWTAERGQKILSLLNSTEQKGRKAYPIPPIGADHVYADRNFFQDLMTTLKKKYKSSDKHKLLEKAWWTKDHGIRAIVYGIAHFDKIVLAGIDIWETQYWPQDEGQHSQIRHVARTKPFRPGGAKCRSTVVMLVLCQLIDEFNDIEFVVHTGSNRLMKALDPMDVQAHHASY